MKELAEFLKTERLNRNLTLEAVSELSGISVSMLISLEACDFERFGASILIRNTIRAYCRALRIEAEPLIEKVCCEIEGYNTQDAGIRRYGQQMKLLHKRRRMISLPLLSPVFDLCGRFLRRYVGIGKTLKAVRPTGRKQGFYPGGDPCRLAGTAGVRPGRSDRQART